jgi:hypothetical protein
LDRVSNIYLAVEVCGAPFSNVSFSIAASIILFPLMIDVVQMMMFLRAVLAVASKLAIAPPGESMLLAENH